MQTRHLSFCPCCTTLGLLSSLGFLTDSQLQTSHLLLHICGIGHLQSVSQFGHILLQSPDLLQELGVVLHQVLFPLGPGRFGRPVLRLITFADCGLGLLG